MTPKSEKISEVQNLTVEEIAERAPQLDAASLKELRRLETEDGKADGRKGVIAAIDAAELQLAPATADKEDARPTATTGAPAKAPAWQAPDYNGPITIDQASWRRENIKPVRKVQTK